MKLKNVQVGADCEVFLQNKQTNEIVSAEGIIRGTKDVPFVFDEKNQFFCTSLDNILAEFCIPPAKSAEEFYNNIQKSMEYIGSTIPNDLCVAAVPSAILDSKYLQTEQSQIFGCEPDYNAYTQFINNRPMAENENLRSAGGHLHIGYDGAKQFDKFMYKPDKTRCDIVKTLDLFLGIPSVIMEPDNMRKELYGKAGAFRPKPYGVEYRTISNFYLANKEYTLWAYNAVNRAIEYINNGNTIDENLSWVIRDIIDNNRKGDAQQLINDFNLAIAA